MTCHSPLTAWKSRDIDDYSTATGKGRLVFNASKGLPSTRMEIACGQCAGCRLDKARDWAIRCVHEAQLHDKNSFLTLTYDDDNIPPDYSLRPIDITNFLKRLRKHLSPCKIRFLQVGEYGEINKRPHHHLLIFGYDFPDKLLIRSSSKHPLFTSPIVQKLWPFGFNSIGQLTFDSACYCTRYTLKKITGEKAAEHYNGRHKEYITMSRRPGIGRDFYNRFSADLYNHDQCVVRAGFLAKPPKYYDNLFEIDNPSDFGVIKAQRRQAAIDNKLSEERLNTLSEIQKIKTKKIPRKIEE